MTTEELFDKKAGTILLGIEDVCSGIELLLKTGSF